MGWTQIKLAFNTERPIDIFRFCQTVVEVRCEIAVGIKVAATPGIYWFIGMVYVPAEIKEAGHMIIEFLLMV